MFRYAALKAARRIPESCKIFLNVNPNIIQDEKFRQGFTRSYLEDFAIQPHRIFFELTERESVLNVDSFKNIIEHYKSQNYTIGLDDVGAGYSGLNLISDIHPHFIKLDMNLVRDIDKDLTKQAIVRSMREFAALTETFLIAEGVETREELAKLIEFDVPFAQGFFIQRPSDAIHDIEEHVAECILRENKIKKRFSGTKVQDFHIRNIRRPLLSVPPDHPATDLHGVFESNSNLHGVCVVECGVPLGVITRARFSQHNAGRGRVGRASLFGQRADDLMDPDFLRVDYKATIDHVAKKAMCRDLEKIYDFVVITRDDRYYGVVTVKELLEKTIELEMAHTKSLNPLSDLPGRTRVEAQLESALHQRQPCMALYFDLDNFKAYNEHYGFDQGDRVLKCFARILRSRIPEPAFVGHYGGDDFIVLTDPEGAFQTCSSIIEHFDAIASGFYTEQDARRGYFLLKTRNGGEQRHPLITLSVVGLYPARYRSLAALHEAAARLIQACKQGAGSGVLFEPSQE